MKEIVVKDKTFVETLTEENIRARVTDLARRISREYDAENPPLLLSVLNGAFVFTADLLRLLDFDPEVQFVRLSSYDGGMESSGNVRALLDLHADVKGRDVLLVEDIVDTGNTLAWLRGYVNGKGAATVRMACLLFKEEVFESGPPPEYYCFRIPNEFVVGYGLDYMEHGRHLRSVYKLKS